MHFLEWQTAIHIRQGALPPTQEKSGHIAHKKEGNQNEKGWPARQAPVGIHTGRGLVKDLGRSQGIRQMMQASLSVAGFLWLPQKKREAEASRF